MLAGQGRGDGVRRWQRRSTEKTLQMRRYHTDKTDKSLSSLIPFPEIYYKHTLLLKGWIRMEELLKQLLTEVREIKASQARTEQRLEGVEAESRATREGLARMENDMGAKVSALFDAREVQMDVNERVCSSLQRIESKLDRISLRVASHDAAIKLAK